MRSCIMNGTDDNDGVRVAREGPTRFLDGDYDEEAASWHGMLVSWSPGHRVYAIRGSYRSRLFITPGILTWRGLASDHEDW